MGKKAGPPRRPVFLPRPPACLKLFAEESFDIADSNQEVEEEAESIQSRLREILTQVWDENATFQRIMYKNQNQHRRTVYFRRLLQVRRDLLLLQSFGLKDVVEALTHCVSFSKHKTLPPKAVLGSLGQGLESKEHLSLAVRRRLLGAARLLHLMADPILSASSLIAGLLSQSFFMPFALTVLALLARFRVLLVQALYEMIAAFNLVSAFVQKMETPSLQAHDVPLFLECSWDGVKLKLFEKMPPLPPPPPPPPQELNPLPTCLSDAGKLPDVGWFVDDRSILVKEKLQSTAGVLEPVLYEREKSFILEDSQFELLGEEEDVVGTAGISVETVPTPSSAISNREAEEVSSGSQEMSLMAGIPVEATPTTSSAISNGEVDVSLGIHEMAQSSSTVREAELESWVSKEADKLVEEPSALDENTKKRVAYVSVQIGGAKESKIMKTEHQM